MAMPRPGLQGFLVDLMWAGGEGFGGLGQGPCLRCLKAPSKKTGQRLILQTNSRQEQREAVPGSCSWIPRQVTGKSDGRKAAPPTLFSGHSDHNLRWGCDCSQLLHLPPSSSLACTCASFQSHTPSLLPPHLPRTPFLQSRKLRPQGVPSTPSGEVVGWECGHAPWSRFLS